MSGRPSGSGLDVAYQRADRAPRPVAPRGPSTGAKVGALAVTAIVFVGSVAGLLKVVHRAGRSVVGLLPRAFDATSTVSSGAVAISLLIAAITVGFIGVKGHPRSWAMISSAASLLIGSLAMVTVTLVSTEENPTPPDGALLMPWVVPMGLAFLGLGIAGRAMSMFAWGGVKRRVLAPLLAILAAVVFFGGVELSALGARLPHF